MEENKVYTAIGLMSGTSLDGVDAAVIETDGADYVVPRGFVTLPYSAAERAVIRACFGVRDREAAAVKTAERLLTMKHVEAVKALNTRGDVIGFHGQTIFHAPGEGVTIQIGDAALLAHETGMDVAYDFRAADVAAGGEGAPLAPVYHAARIRGAGLDLPVAVLNIGGVANVTWIGPGENSLMAFDTGPGNALIDDWILKHTGKPYDADGALAASGTVIESVLKAWMGHDYFARPAPKSLDRDQWDIAALGPLAQEILQASPEEGAATLMAFSVEAIVHSVRHMPDAPKHWYACGGGRRNVAMMAMLKDRLAKAGYGTLHSVDDLGWDGDATEAECFAYLAVRHLRGLPLSFPKTTGVPTPMCGGRFYKVEA